MDLFDIFYIITLIQLLLFLFEGIVITHFIMGPEQHYYHSLIILKSEVMKLEDKTKLRLTAAEMSTLWSQYLNDSLAICVSSYFLENLEDEETHPILEFVLQTAKKNVSTLKKIFTKDEFPIPYGFTEQDVNTQAPKLFSDTFVQMYFKNMSILGMAPSGAALGLATRPDVISFHKSVLEASVHLQDLTRDIMLKQGTYIKPTLYINPGQG